LAQLPLALALKDHASFETFVAGSNATAVEHVRSVVHGGRDTVWLWGGEGAGKTHLLQAACREAAASGRRAMYVALPAASPEILSDLEHVDVLAIDDLHAVAGDLTWEQALFVILNMMLTQLIIEPITQLSDLADHMSKGRADVPELQTKGRDEVAQLGQAFNRMRRSLQKAISLIDKE